MFFTLILCNPPWLIASSSALEDDADDAVAGSKSSGSASEQRAIPRVDTRMGGSSSTGLEFSRARHGRAIGPRCSNVRPEVASSDLFGRKQSKQMVGLEESLARAIADLQEDRFDEAEGALAQVLASEPEQCDALHFLGVLRHQQWRSDEGVA